VDDEVRLKGVKATSIVFKWPAFGTLQGGLLIPDGFVVRKDPNALKKLYLQANDETQSRVCERRAAGKPVDCALDTGTNLMLEHFS
jgi:hypothetical protein